MSIALNYFLAEAAEKTLVAKKVFAGLALNSAGVSSVCPTDSKR